MNARVVYLLVVALGLMSLPAFPQSPGFSIHEMDSLNSALRIAKQDSDKIRVRCRMGVVSKVTRPSFWDSLFKEAHTHNLPFYACKALAGLGHAYEARGQTAKAAEYLRKSLILAEARGYKREVMALINDLTWLTQDQGDRQARLDLSYKGLKIAEELNDKHRAVNFYSDIALHYFFLEDISKALEMHFHCLRICRELDYDLGIASALVDIGSDYHALNDLQNASKYYLASKPYADNYGKTIYGAYIYNSIAAGYELIGQSDSAYKYSCKAYQVARDFNNKRAISSTAIVIAKVLLQKGDEKGAEEKALEALHLARAGGFVLQIPDPAFFLKKLYLEKKEYKKAMEAFEMYAAAKDTISNEKSRKQVLRREFASSMEKKEHENKLLAQQNRVKSLQLNQNNYVLSTLIALIGLIVIIGYLFLRQNKLKSEQQNVKLEQKLLRLQMNPHFIFNSLNSIQQFIISRQNNRAELYLSKFASLIRELLESNNKESISVSEEAGILRGYIEMEALRFKKAFSYSVTVHKSIDPERSHIPLMMIQPFVENAIWHGLLPKDGSRNLRIAFEPGPLKGTLLCTIDDDGVGRNASMAQAAVLKKRSLAIGFIKQRIQLLRKTLKVDCSIRILDKLSDRGDSLGTQIVMVLPLLTK